MICDKVRDVDEISVFICADGIKLVERGDASHRFMSTTVGKCRIYIRRRCDWGLRHCVAQSQSHLKSFTWSFVKGDWEN